MKQRRRQTQILRSLLIGLALLLIGAGSAAATKLHPKLLAKVGYGGTPIGFARTSDGTFHVVFETNTNWGDSANGVGAIAISPSGHISPQVQALSWGGPGGSPNGIPGLAIMPGGSLEAVFGGSPSSDPGPWGISSANGGATWSSPVDIGSGAMEAGDSSMTLALSQGTPVLTAGCCGGIVIQRGFGPSAPTYQLTNSSDDVAGDTDTAVDAATGAVIAGWVSNAGSGGLWLQQAAPSVGTAQKVPVPPQYGTGEPLIVAGRDSGPGVFATYPATYGNTTKIRLLRYGGGSVAVGSVNGLHADAWGAATGSDGRIWVFWSGQINGKSIIAVTRSNTAVTRFEPIQRYFFNWSFLFTMSGDGRLGPLDMLINGTPSASGAAGGIYWARIVPVLSARIRVVDLGHGKFKLKVKVTDAGDPVSDASAAAKGKLKGTNGHGTAKLKIRGSSGEHVAVVITAPGYRTLRETITL